MTAPNNRAFRWQVAVCGSPTCRHPHLCFLDEQGALIADAVIDRDSIDHLADVLRKAVAEIDAGGERHDH